MHPGEWSDAADHFPGETSSRMCPINARWV